MSALQDFSIALLRAHANLPPLKEPVFEPLRNKGPDPMLAIITLHTTYPPMGFDQLAAVAGLTFALAVDQYVDERAYVQNHLPTYGQDPDDLVQQGFHALFCDAYEREKEKQRKYLESQRWRRDFTPPHYSRDRYDHRTPPQYSRDSYDHRSHWGLNLPRSLEAEICTRPNCTRNRGCVCEEGGGKRQRTERLGG